MIELAFQVWVEDQIDRGILSVKKLEEAFQADQMQWFLRFCREEEGALGCVVQNVLHKVLKQEREND